MTQTEQPHIHVKSYFASNIPDAIEVARNELGPDALLLNSRRAPPENELPRESWFIVLAV